MPSILKRLIANPLIKLVFSFSLLYFVFRQVDVHQVWATVITVPISALILFTILWSTLYFLGAWRWSLLLFRNPTKNQYLACLRATFVGLFYNLVMPSAAGGDLIKWTALSRYQISKKRLLFTVFLDRFVGLVGLVMSGVTAIIMAHTLGIFKLPTNIVIVIAFISLAVGLGWIVLLFSHLWTQIKFIEKISWLSKILKYATIHRKVLIQSFFISIVIQALANISVYFLAKGVGFHSNLIVFFILEPIVALITTIPVSFAGLGTTEAASLYFFQAVGETSIIILAFTTLLTIFRFIFGLIGWLALVVDKKNSN